MLTGWDWTGVFGGLISFAVVLYVQRAQRIRQSRGTTVSLIAFAGLVAYVWAPSVSQTPTGHGHRSGAM